MFKSSRAHHRKLSRLTPECGAEDLGVEAFLVLADLRGVGGADLVTGGRHVHVDVALATSAAARSESERQERPLLVLQLERRLTTGLADRRTVLKREHANVQVS